MFPSKPASRSTQAGTLSLLESLNPVTMVRHLWRNQDLIRQFTRREIEGRYKGSILGVLWSFITPLVMLAIYTYIFGIVFAARWPGARTEGLGDFAVLLFCGLTVFNIFGETVGKAPLQVVSVPNYVKKVVFPLEILAVSSLGAALFHAGISFTILLIAHLIGTGIISWTLIIFPIVLLPLLFLTLGTSWILASLGVFLRDIGYTISLIIQILFFLTPIFYPISNVPIPFQPFIRLNPLTGTVENMRRIILFGELPIWNDIIVSYIIGSIILIIGFSFFMKTKKAFADVI